MADHDRGLRVSVHTDPVIFAERADPVIRRDPVRSCVLATNLDAALRGDAVPGSLWIVVATGPGADDDGAVLLGMITPPFPLWLTPIVGADPGPVGAALADTLAGFAEGPARELPGVRGARDSVLAFAEAWQRRTGRRPREIGAERMFELTELIWPDGVAGAARPATDADRDLCLDWVRAFQAEAMPNRVRHDPAQLVDRRIRDGELTLWEDGGRPVSLAGTFPVVAGVARVGPVYTPPEHRRHGYGAAVTAAATRAGFAAGAERCMLHTDLANPTSNALYPRLGYRPVGDALDLALI